MIGRILELDGTVHRIIGVAPAGFRFPANAQLWTSLVLSPERLNRRGYNMSLTVLTRLKERVTPPEAVDRVNRFVQAITSRLVQVPFFRQAAVLVRSRGPATALIRNVVRQANGSVALYDGQSMEGRIEEALGVRRVLTVLVSVFAAICLFLAGIGLNGVVSQIVGERAPEIGVRMVLGARPVQILAQFLRYGLAWGAAGVGIGLAAATYTQRWLKDLLFGIQPFDMGTFCVASLGVLLIVLMAVWWPAWRASRIDPQSVLRHE